MSALPPKADIANLARHDRFVPKMDSCTAADIIKKVTARGGVAYSFFLG
jgi:hypothetical protein